MKKSVRTLAERVRDALELEGIHTHWDDATTTGSVYLDLDHGILGSIRISDHKGKGNGYLFEIGSHVDTRHTVDKSAFDQVYLVEKFPEVSLTELVEAVLIARMKIMAQVGVQTYKDKITNDRAAEDHLHSEGPRRKSRARAGNSDQ